MRQRLRTALLGARAAATFARMDVVAVAAAAVALLPLAVRGRPLCARRSALEPPSQAGEEGRRAETGESPTGSG